MLEKLKWINFSNPNTTTEVMVCLALVWLIVLGCTLWSIRTHEFRRPVRWFWTGVVVLVPLIGLLVYLPFSLMRESVPFANLWWRAGSDRS